MSKTWAIVLSIIGGLFLLAIVAIGVVGYWFYQNKGRLIRAAVDIEKVAKEFGAKTDNEGCLNEAVSRQKSDKSVTGRMKKCADAGLQNDQGCQQLFGVVQSYCQRSKKENGEREKTQ